MGEKDNGQAQEVDHGAQMNQFTGGSFVDGVRQEPAKGADDKDTKEGQQSKPTGKQQDTQAAGEGDDTQDGGAKEGDKGEKHRSAQDRIDKAVKGQRKAERERDALRSELAATNQRLAGIEARLNGAGGGAKPSANSSDGEPDPTKYEGGEFDAKYIRDLARYEAKKAATETSRQSAAAAQTQEQQQAAAAFKVQLDEFTEKATEIYDDFAEVVFDESNKFSATLVELSLDSEFGAQIAYELALDPKEQRRLAALSPSKQAVWFGQREAELSSQAGDAKKQNGESSGDDSDTAKPKPKAPPPPQHQSKGNGGTGAVSAATEDFGAFERMAMGSTK